MIITLLWLLVVNNNLYDIYFKNYFLSLSSQDFKTLSYENLTKLPTQIIKKEVTWKSEMLKTENERKFIW